VEKGGAMGNEGSLHVLLIDRAKEIYKISFAPYQSGGEGLETKDIHGRDGFKKYLRRLKIHEDIIETALQDVQQNGTCEIPNIILDSSRLPTE
jgi:hypothetical protein